MSPEPDAVRGSGSARFGFHDRLPPYIACAIRLSGLLRRHLPRQVEGREVWEWSITGPAMMTRAVRTVESLYSLLPPFAGGIPANPSGIPLPSLDATVLLRSLYDGVLAFSWISLDVHANMPRWLKHSCAESIRTDKNWRDLGMPLLDDRNLEFCKEKARAAVKGLPDRLQMAEQVDAKYGGVFPGPPALEGKDRDLLGMRGLYIHIYRLGSVATHQGLNQLRSMITLDPLGATILHEEKADEHTLYPWLVAPWVLGVGLSMLAEGYGWPGPADVHDALEHVYFSYEDG